MRKAEDVTNRAIKDLQMFFIKNSCLIVNQIPEKVNSLRSFPRVHLPGRADIFTWVCAARRTAPFDVEKTGRDS